jgi:pyridoxal phosphate enzyme (YggS family)
MESVIGANIRKIKQEIPAHIKLIAVSKTKPLSAILEAYQQGQRLFGENKVQEWADKHPQLPQDIEWHLIGHLQSNKVKYIAGKVAMIHGVDSAKLLQEINKHAAKANAVQDCLLQVHIAQEETKFGFSADELIAYINTLKSNPLTSVRIRGLMGMATFTEDQALIRKEFTDLQGCYKKVADMLASPDFNTLSMGMSSDYKIAIECGSNMIRVGSDIFGSRS